MLYALVFVAESKGNHAVRKFAGEHAEVVVGER